MLGWDVNIRDSDGHYIIEKGQKKQIIKPVTIGNHVWICSHAHILKGVVIGNDSVISYGSIVLGKFNSNNLLIGGIPAKIIREDIN